MNRSQPLARRSSTATRKGLTVRTFKGLDKKRIEKKGRGQGNRLAIEQGETVSVQFLSTPDEFTEFYTHSWKDDRWYFVPCAGDGCPLCEDEDRDKAKVGYRFATLVYSFKDKDIKILEGPKDLAGRIMYRYERRPSLFLKRTYEITKMATTPVSYEFAVGEDDLIAAATIKSKLSKAISIEDYLEGELRSYWGDDLPGTGSITEDDGDEDEDEDEDEEEAEYSLADLRKMKLIKLQEIAEDREIDTEDMDKSDLIEAIMEAAEGVPDEDEDDEDEDESEDDEDEDDESDEDEEDDDEDDDEDEDEDEDDEEPRRPAKKAAKSVKKAPAKKVPAKKAAARRR
jgi:hypothetical protein